MSDMLCVPFQSPAWYAAANLVERVESLGRYSARSVNTELARKRLQRWRSQRPFEKDSLFADRLAADELCEDDLLRLLGEPVDATAGRFAAPPAWLFELDRNLGSAEEEAASVETWRETEWAGFFDAIAPLIDHGRSLIARGVAALAGSGVELPFSADAVDTLFLPNLLPQLGRLATRTLVLELQVARLEGFLKGDTAEARFASFNQRLRQRSVALALLEEYPVLARQLVTRIECWAAFTLEFLQHLAADWPVLRAALSPHEHPGRLVEIHGNAGDSHREGRAVLIAGFDSGFRVVYKPKSLAVDRHFQELLVWLNDHGVPNPFRTLITLDRGDYGWVEFVPAAACTEAAQVERFYERQGGYLALLYALEATDFHSENLIAAGEHPVLIDLEALFHPRVRGVEADEVTAGALENSVMRIGLLPVRAWSNEESAGVDISGLGSAEGELTPLGVPMLDKVGTDEMHVIRKRLVMGADNNRPTLKGAAVNLTDYTEAIVRGFSAVYHLLQEHRAELLAADGPLARFAADEIRFIARGTRSYSILLAESYHPDVLRSALDRDRLLDRLWAPVEYSPHLARLIAAERADLWRGDIPMFTTHSGSRDLWSSTGERIADFFDESGLELVRRRIEQLDDRDMAQQLWIVRASLATAAKTPQPTYHLRGSDASVDREALLAAARAVGDRLEEQALHGRHNVAWLGLRLADERYWNLGPLGADLYDGLPGVALFLAHLGRITGVARYTDTAEAALRSVRRQLEVNGRWVKSIGGFHGWGGLIYTLAHLGSIWQRPELWAEGEDMLALLPELIDADETLDVIGGAAGCIGGLLSLHRASGSRSALALAGRCGERLLDRVQPMESGVAWRTRLPARAPLTGFSHGAAGMSWALLELAAATGQERFRATALAALDYERSQFLDEAGNWPDYRLLGDPCQRCFTTWCHGAPGIGLARLEALRHVDDAVTRKEIAVALATTRAHGFGKNHTLCHGDLGNLELLHTAARRLDGSLRSEVGRLAGGIVASIRSDGWLCGAPLAVQSPGLMTGLAGIGYGLLRLAEPETIPSVLVLAPPAGSASLSVGPERGSRKRAQLVS
jgi:type 2 lantibiotic biosynthesis protein LanM